MNTPQDRLARALISLEGLSVGDAFGERFFLAPSLAYSLIKQRALPKPPWRWTDDTAMAVAIVEILGHHGAIDQDGLAQQFAERYIHEPARGYAQGMHRLLPAIQEGLPWRKGAPQLFNGQGSFGNGAAMRVAPVGGYFAEDLSVVVDHARQSAEITHTHPEGVAGAIAVALAAAIAWHWGQESIKPHPAAFLEAILQFVPTGEVRKRMEQAQALPIDTPISSLVQVLGNGSQVSAQDTVPFALWCAAQHLDNYEEALWLTVSGRGDVDTTAAIVGGIVALYTGVEGIPAEWRASREPLPASFKPDESAVEA
jgi:ADP-ribosylglycohydrolase